MKSEQRRRPDRPAFLPRAGVAVWSMAVRGRLMLAASRAVVLPPELLHPPVYSVADLGPPPPVRAGRPRKAALASNMQGTSGRLACRVIGVRGDLVGSYPPIASALSCALRKAGARVAARPDQIGTIAVGYALALQADPAGLARMSREMGHCQLAVGIKFRNQAVPYAGLLELIGVFRQPTVSDRLAGRVTVNQVA